MKRAVQRHAGCHPMHFITGDTYAREQMSRAGREKMKRQFDKKQVVRNTIRAMFSDGTTSG